MNWPIDLVFRSYVRFDQDIIEIKILAKFDEDRTKLIIIKSVHKLELREDVRKEAQVNHYVA